MTQSFSVLAAIVRTRRAGLLRLRRAEAPLSFRCLGSRCSLCCKVAGGGVVTDSARRANACVSAVMPSHKGKCTALTAGQCSIYVERPQGCQEYPWYNLGGRLYYDSGCPGIRRGMGDDRPAPAKIAPAQNYFSLPPWLQRVCLWAVVRW